MTSINVPVHTWYVPDLLKILMDRERDSVAEEESTVHSTKRLIQGGIVVYNSGVGW